MSEVVVVGGGLVGLATAWALSQAGHGVTVVEKESDWAQHQSGHNSGVVHSGLYYKPGSHKAVMAVQAARELEHFCAEHGIAFDRCGKLVAATSEAELPRMATLVERGRANGVPLREIGPAEARDHEPHVRCIAGLWVESTAVVDFPQLAQVLAKLLDAAGARLLLNTKVVDLKPAGDGTAVLIEHADGRREVITADKAAVCAGLHSDQLYRRRGLPGQVPAGEDQTRIVPFRGEYLGLKPERAHLVKGLIYPVPDPSMPFLGVHLTRGIDGHIHVGPSAVLAGAREGYRWRDVSLADLADSLSFPGTWKVVAANRQYIGGEIGRSLSRALMVRAVNQLMPEVTADDLEPAEAGVRAQAVRRDGTLIEDFEFRRQGPVLHVINAPSPAATASLLIGQEIVRQLMAV